MSPQEEFIVKMASEALYKKSPCFTERRRLSKTRA